MGRAQWAMVVVVVVLVAGVIMVYRSFDAAQERPAVQRITAHELLADHAAFLAAYRDDHEGDWPDNLLQLIAYAKELREAGRGPDAELHWTTNRIPKTGIEYRYRPPPEGAGGEVIVMAALEPNRGVRAGEPYGGKGQVAETDIPPVHIVLNADLEIEALAPAVARRRASWLFTGVGADATPQEHEP